MLTNHQKVDVFDYGNEFCFIGKIYILASLFTQCILILYIYAQLKAN